MARKAGMIPNAQKFILYADDGPESNHIEDELRKKGITFRMVRVPPDYAARMPELWVNGYKFGGVAAITTHVLRPAINQ